MKTLFCSLLLSTLFIGCASLNSITPEQGYKEYIENTNLNKNDAFDQTLIWAAKTFNSSNDVIQLKDAEAGIIIIQAMSSYYYDALQTTLIYYRYTLEIRIKEQKIKLAFTTGQTVNSGQLPQQGDLKKVLAKYESIKTDLINYLNKPLDNF